MKQFVSIIIILCTVLISTTSIACSVLYYIDPDTGKIYVVNNEDYWYDVDSYITIEPKSKNKLARLWYGWNNFAQGGVNENGLFFDAAVTPIQQNIKGFKNPKNNLGDKILANCTTVEDALAFLEKEKIALNQSHIMFGDKSGKAVIVEWVDGARQLHWIQDNRLIMTNYLLSKPEAGNHPCFRYQSINQKINEMEKSTDEIDLLKVGNTFGQAAQLPRKNDNGRIGGTVYTSFIDITDNLFFLSYKLSNQEVIKLDLNIEFSKTKKQTIKLDHK